MRLWVFLLAVCAAAQPFRMQEIATGFGIGYAVITADVNGDRRPDIVAINQTQVVWFENPSWTKHVIADGATKKDNVCIAASDVDGDGRMDFAVGADWQATNTASGGSLQWFRQPGTAGAAWPMTALLEEPTLHRMRFGDVDGDGKDELVVAPLHARKATREAGWLDGLGARILVLRPGREPLKPWSVEVADESLHIVHNLLIVEGEIWTASAEGVHALRRDKAGKWSRRKLGEGRPGEIKLGRVNGVRTLATVEPWHGNAIVLYEEPAGGAGLWRRAEIESKLTEGHGLGWGDFDGDGSDELVAGWRRAPHGLALYRRQGLDWARTQIDDGVAVEDLAVADLNADGRPEIVAAGRATANVRIYWNEVSRRAGR